MISALELRRQFLHMAFGIFLVTMLYFHFFNIYHLIGILILGLIFSRLCKSYTIPLASWVMEKFERPENRKTFPGKGPIFFTIGSIIVVSFFGALLFVNVFAALSGSLLSMVLETLKLDYIDDNLLVPVTAALIMSIF